MTATSTVEFSNSHLSAISGTPCRVEEAGIDTWRLVRYLDNDRELDAAARATAPNGVWPHPIAGHRVGVLPGRRMLWAEGHPAVDGLGAPAHLSAAEDRLLDELADVGLPVGRDGGVGRLDLTVTLRFADPRQGLGFLSGLAMVDVPRLKPARYGKPGIPETVYWLAERSGKAMSRAYDKGFEARLAERGVLIRLEDQRRFQKEARMRAKVHAEANTARAFFGARFAPIAESCEGLTAGTLDVLAEHLAEKVTDGEMTSRQFERLVGYLVGQDRGVPYARRTRYRRRRELRDHGLVLSDPFEDSMEIDLGEPLEAALRAWDEAAA